MKVPSLQRNFRNKSSKKFRFWPKIFSRVLAGNGTEKNLRSSGRNQVPVYFLV